MSRPTVYRRVQESSRLGWGAIAFGLAREWLTWADVESFARARIVETRSAEEQELLIDFFVHDDVVKQRQVIAKLAMSQPDGECIWHVAHLCDVLDRHTDSNWETLMAAIEELQAELEYPESLAFATRYSATADDPVAKVIEYAHKQARRLDIQAPALEVAPAA